MAEPTDWAALVAGLRAEHGWSQRELARQLRRLDHRVPDVASVVRSIRRWENGGIRPDERYAPLLLQLRTVPRAVAAGGPAAAVADLIHHYRLADDTAPSGSLTAAVSAIATLAEQLAGDARTEAEQQAAVRVLAESRRQQWWLLTDAGDRAGAEAAHAQAMTCAVESGYAPFVAHLLASRAAAAVAAGDLAAAIRLARQARDRRWSATPAGTAWAATQEVRALLATGGPGVERAVEDARTAYAAVRDGDEPRWLYWLTGPVLELEAADMAMVAEGLDAAEAVEAGLAGLPSERVRDHAWYRGRLAATRARAGDLDGAVADTERAVQLARAAGSDWPLAEVRQLARSPHLRVLRGPLFDA